jgi:regulation of enolase protein 1 (concanavalin A-like superfamily)
MNLLNLIRDNNLPDSLAWFNEPKDWRYDGGKLEVNALPETDFFNDPESKGIRNSAHYLYAYAKGDFSLTTRVEISMDNMFDAGCLMIMGDSNNWAKLCYENWLNEPSIVSVVTRNLSDDCPSIRIGREKPYLKILRSGDCFGFFYSLDKENWTLIRFFTLDLPEEIKVGLVAQSPVGTGCKVHFELLDLVLMKIGSARYIAKE